MYQAVSRDNDSNELKGFIQSQGPRESANEHLVPEQLFDDPNTTEKEVEGVSAVKAIQIAQEQGQTVYTITQENYSQIIPKLSLSSGVMTDIRDNVAVGRTVTVHEKTINYKGWKGSGYIIIDPQTGSGAYLIDGGANGAAAFFLGKIMGLMLTVITLSILYTPQLYANPLTAAAMFGVMSTVTILLHFALFQIAFIWNAEVRKCFVGGLFVGLGPLGLFNKVGLLGKILGVLGIASLEGYEFVRTNDKETCMKIN